MGPNHCLAQPPVWAGCGQLLPEQCRALLQRSLATRARAPGAVCAGDENISISCSPTERPRRRRDGAYSAQASSYDRFNDKFVSRSQDSAPLLLPAPCATSGCCSALAVILLVAVPV